MARHRAPPSSRGGWADSDDDEDNVDDEDDMEADNVEFPGPEIRGVRCCENQAVHVPALWVHRLGIQTDIGSGLKPVIS
jgi:hypothetical protein